MATKFGTLTFTRIYSGRLNKGDTVLNTNTGKKERVGRIVEMHAIEQKDVDSAGTGDIVALVGLKDAVTGHTLSDQSQACYSRPHGFPRSCD